MRIFAIFLPAICYISLAYTQTSSALLTIAQGGQTTYQITYASEPARDAALELQRYLRQATGADFPVAPVEKRGSGPAIRLQLDVQAQSARTPLTSGWLQLQAKGKDVFIGASDAEYLWYAVYEFLETFAGCRWLDPETDDVPQIDKLVVPADLDYRYQPDIATRTVHSRLFYDHPEFARKLRVTAESFPYFSPDARVHTFHRFLPESVYFESHPEYYALREGRRIPTQLCLSNEAVLKIVIDSVRAQFERYPDAQAISVSQDDNTQYCTCPACSRSDAEEGSPAGTLLRFVNKVAEQFPDKTITTLAYQYTRSPGKTKPADNVLITLCSIECDRSGPITEKCTDFADDLAAWRAMGANLRIWDYTTQFTNFLAPFPNLYTLQPNVQLFRNSGARWVFEQHSHHPSELFELRSYLTAKLLWNPELDFEATMNDFCNRYYGPAAPFVLDYIHTIHAELAKHPDFFLFLYGDPSQAFDSYLSADLLEQYRSLMDSAEAAVSAAANIHGRVRRARLSVDFAVLEACRRKLSAGLSLQQPWAPARLQTFALVCQNNDITLMNEMGYTVEEYVQAYQTTLERAALPNLAASKPVTLLTKPKKYAGENPQALTDGAFGGASFYANWLGFEGNDLIAEVDLGAVQRVAHTGMAFLQVVNHIVFFPVEVEYWYAGEDKQFKPLGKVANPRPLERQSKVNDLFYFGLDFAPVQARYLKVHAQSLQQAPWWHHGAGLPCWIFADEWLVR